MRIYVCFNLWTVTGPCCKTALHFPWKCVWWVAPSCDITAASLSPWNWINSQTQSSFCQETEKCDPTLALPPSTSVPAVVIICSLNGARGKLCDYGVNKLYLEGKISVPEKFCFPFLIFILFLFYFIKGKYSEVYSSKIAISSLFH